MRRCIALGLAALTVQAGASMSRADAPKIGVFDQCAACHSSDGTNGTGPTLKGVIGRQSGTVSGFRYSRAMRAAGITWDAKSLDQYLSNPQQFIPGNVMPFSGVAEAGDRTAIIAYLQSIK